MVAPLSIFELILKLILDFKDDFAHPKDAEILLAYLQPPPSLFPHQKLHSDEFEKYLTTPAAFGVLIDALSLDTDPLCLVSLYNFLASVTLGIFLSTSS